jgi:chromosome partitioning protein
MPGKILTEAMFKGGTGKTTTACNLAFYAAERGYRTLLVDLDAQGNATDTLGGDKWTSRDPHQAFELFESFVSPRQPLAVSAQLDILPTARAEPRLRVVDRLPRHAALPFRKNLRILAEQYDLVLIDTPPSMNFGMEAPLIASDYVLCPICPDKYSVNGAKELLGTFERIRAKENPDLKFLGFLVNRLKSVDRDHAEIMIGLRKSLGRYLVPHSLPESVPIARIQRQRSPLWRLATSGAERRASNALKEVGDWVLTQVLGKAAVPMTVRGAATEKAVSP